MEVMQGAPSTGATVGQEVSSPETGTFDEAEFNRINGRGDSPSLDETEARPEGDQDPAEAKEPTEPDDKKDGEQPTKTAKRIEQLLKDRKEAQASLQKIQQEFATKELRYKAALQKTVADIAALKQELAQYVDVDAPEYKLRDIESQKRVQAEVTAQERQLQERFAKEQEQSELRALQDELYSAMDDAISEYPGLTRAQLQAKLKEHAAQNPDVSYDQAPELFKQLAQQIDEELYSRYEARALEKHKPRLSAPSTVTTSGTVRSPTVASTRDEMIADLERKFGPGRFG